MRMPRCVSLLPTRIYARRRPGRFATTELESPPRRPKDVFLKFLHRFSLSSIAIFVLINVLWLLNRGHCNRGGLTSTISDPIIITLSIRIQTFFPFQYIPFRSFVDVKLLERHDNYVNVNRSNRRHRSLNDIRFCIRMKRLSSMDHRFLYKYANHNCLANEMRRV